MKSSRVLRAAILCTTFLGTLQFFAACATSPYASSPARMTTPQEDASRLFEVLDVDGNGFVSREEARAGFQYLIASYDRGGKVEVLAAKPGAAPGNSVKRKSKRRPSAQDANKAFEALFQNSAKGSGSATGSASGSASAQASDGVSKEEFKKLVVKSSDNPDTDPFVAFY